MKKRFISLLLSILIFCGMLATPSTVLAAAPTVVKDGDVIQANFEVGDSQYDVYTLTATETKYYKFSFLNQSIESRTGIAFGAVDSILNLFFGKINIEIFDHYDLRLAEFSVRCGYEGNVSLKLNEGSTYTIKVQSNVAGNYRMKVNSYADIGGDTWDNATETLSVGQMISSIDAEGDQDWYWFKTDDSSSFYEFSLENIRGNTKNLWVYEYVEGAGQTPLRDTFNIRAYESNTSTHQLKLKPNTKYYMCILQNSGIGGYQLDITQTLDAVEDVQEKAYEVTPDTKVTTAFDGQGDVDWFKFTTKNYDSYYHFNIENLSIGSGYYYIEVYDASMNKLVDGRSFSSYANDPYALSVNEKLEPNTEYYFKIFADSSSKGNYSFKITDINDPQGDSMETSSNLTLNTEISASMGGDDDVDWFKFTTANFAAYYHFKIQSLSLTDYYYIDIYDVDNNRLLDFRSHPGYGDTASRNIKLNPNTTYYMKAYAYSLGNYKVSVETKPDIYPDEMINAVKISLNTEISTSMDGDDDVDWFKFTTASYGAFYHFNIKSLSLTDYYHIDVYDTDNNRILDIRSHPGYGDNASGSIKLNPNTTYYLKAYAYSLGNYKVKITTKSDYEGDEKESSGKISMNSSVTKELSANSDVDWFKITVKNDCNIRVLGIVESGGRKKFSLYSEIDRQLIDFRSSDTSDGTAFIEPGTYYIKVSGDEGYYTLCVGDCGSGHKEARRYYQATTSREGIRTTYCKSCKTTIKKESIPKIGKISLSYTSVTYNGNTRKPKIIITDKDGNKITSYTAKWSNSKSRSVGKYSVKITFKYGYSGTKTLYYTIKPKSVSGLKLTAGKKSLKASWKKSSGITGYEIKYSTSSKLKSAKTVTVKSHKTTKKTLKKLKAKKNYYVRIRAYKKVGSKTYYSSWSKAKKIKTK